MRKIRGLKERMLTPIIAVALVGGGALSSYALGNVGITSRKAADVQFSKKEISLEKGEEAVLKLTEQAVVTPSTPSEVGTPGDASTDVYIIKAESNKPDLVTVDWNEDASPSDASKGAKEVTVHAAESPDFTNNGRVATIKATLSNGKTVDCKVTVLGPEVKVSVGKSSIEYGKGTTIKAKASHIQGLNSVDVAISFGDNDENLPYGLSSTPETFSFGETDEEESNELKVYSDPFTGKSGSFKIPVTVTVSGEYDNGEDKNGTYESEPFTEIVTVTVAEPKFSLKADPATLDLNGETETEISVDTEKFDGEILADAFDSYEWKIVDGADVVELVNESASPSDATANDTAIVKAKKKGTATIELNATIESYEEGEEDVTLTATKILTVNDSSQINVETEVNIDTTNITVTATTPDLSTLSEAEIKKVTAEWTAQEEAAKNAMASVLNNPEFKKQLEAEITGINEDFVKNSLDIPWELKDGDTVKVSLKQKPGATGFVRSFKTDENGVKVGVSVLKDVTYDISLEAEKTGMDGSRETAIVETKAGNGNEIKFPIGFSAIGMDPEDKVAQIEHAGDRTRNSDIYEGVSGGKYVKTGATHFSPFKVLLMSEFPDNYVPSGRRSRSGGHSYTPSGQWIQDATGWWYRNPNGSWPKDCWIELNWNGSTQWYRFNQDGYMVAGWFTDVDGHRYFLHNVSDGTQGHMYTGWHQIEGKWYYFHENTGGPKGSLLINGVTPDGYTTDASGVCATYPAR